jgi:class 3 adenylate cyclase
VRWLDGTSSRCVSPVVIQQVHRAGSCEPMRIDRHGPTVPFVDMRGFTGLWRPLPPEGVGERANAFMAAMGPASRRWTARSTRGQAAT